MTNKTEKLNTNTWVTQKALADELGVSITRVSNWLRRGQIEFKHLPNSKIRLVNKDTLKVKL